MVFEGLTEQKGGSMDTMMIQKKESRARSNANLRPIKPGQVLNPKGRGIGKNNIMTWVSHLPAPALVIEELRKKFQLHKGKVTIETAVILRLALEACRGDMKAIEIWLDRQYGKVTQQMDLSTENGPLVAILQNVGVTTPPAPQTQDPKKDG